MKPHPQDAENEKVLAAIRAHGGSATTDHLRDNTGLTNTQLMATLKRLLHTGKISVTEEDHVFVWSDTRRPDVAVVIMTDGSPRIIRDHRV